MKKNVRILAVDDDESVLALLKRVLEREGYDVALVSDSNSVIPLMAEQPPDLVILDVMMPGPSGFEILHLIRQSSNVPVIMLTGKRELSALSVALTLGADDYMLKPFSSEELVARIRAKLRRIGKEVLVSAN